MTTKLTLTPDEAIIDLLKRTGNATRYVERVVEERWRAWQEALARLATTGWRREEVLAVCDALNGYLLMDGRPRGVALALELHDDARLNGAVKKWGLDGDTWRRKVEALERDDDTAHALWVVVSEFWAGNEELEAKLERLPSVQAK